MKKHAIIPIFIPHRGCPNDCVFCNQKAITARQPDVTPDHVRSIIETYLPTLTGRGLETIEVAFFGGSFTGLPMDEQSAFLAVAAEYKRKGLIDKIHMSTRPDYIDTAILDNLRSYDADTIELGVQSFDDGVLAAAGRGHTAAAVYEACSMIHSYGFELGIQLMIGLPGDSLEKCLYSARETVRMRPSIARLYPTIVLQDTALYDMAQAGLYHPLTTPEAVAITKEMYRILLGKLMPWDLIPGFQAWNPDLLTVSVPKPGAGRHFHKPVSRRFYDVDLDALAESLKDWRFDIAGYVGFERCVVTAGGVSSEEILSKTMASRLVKGLYFCGEVMDMDCDTGGYNLQCAFSTGILAGMSAARAVLEDATSSR